MALLKKRPETSATVEDVDDTVASAPEELLGGAGGAAGEADDEPADDAPPPAPPAQTVEAAPDDTDALLRMFQEGESASNDLKALLDVVDDVEIAELIDELQTVASALGVRAG